MAQEAQAPVVRYLTNERLTPANTLRQPEESEEDKSRNMLGLLLIVGMLITGVVGVLLMGPSKAVNTMMGLIHTEKAPEPEQRAEIVESPAPKPAPVRKPRAAAETAKREEAVEAEPQPAPEPQAAPEPPKPPAPKIRPGMPRSQLLEFYGAPAMKATSIEDGHLIESYSYVTPGAQQTVLLEDGRVVEIGEN